MNENNQNEPGLEAAAVGAGAPSSPFAGDGGQAAGGQEGQGGTGQTGAGDAGAGGEQQRPAALDLSDATMQRLATTLSGVQQRQQQAVPAQPQLTKEQIDEMLKVVRLKDEDIADALGLDLERTPKAAKFFRSLVDQLVTHINVVSDVRQRLFTQQHITPMQAYMQQAQNAEHERRFFEAYPDVKPHAKIAKLVYKEMIANGQQFASPDEAYAAIAKGTLALVGGGGAAGGEGGAGGSGNNGAATGGQTPKMSTISMGGRGSGVQQKSANSAPDDVRAIFG